MLQLILTVLQQRTILGGMDMGNSIHTINITDLSCKLSELIEGIKNQNKQYVIMQDGVRIPMVIPVEMQKVDACSEELIEKRLKALEKMVENGKRVSELWNSEENAGEVVSNSRR